MARILKRSSFGLLRTNPKLTTNIKIIGDSNNKVYLESIDADPILSKSKYKGYEVTGGSYFYDIHRFYDQGNLLPKSIAYKLFEEDESNDIKQEYHRQFDFTYGYGMTPKISRIYDEELSLFAPLWIEPDSLPDYFVIFKIDNPVTFNTKDKTIVPDNTNLDNAEFLDELITKPSNFFNNYVKDSRVIKTFDLTEKTELGTYIRKHAGHELFPESSTYINFEKNNLSYWSGMAYDEVGFCSRAKDLYTDYVLVDKTVTENDNFITMGFYENSLIHPNILNLEFLFDDIEQEEYSFSRYFGLYVSEAELGKFNIDGDRLFRDKDNEINQKPRPNFNNIGYENNTKSQIQENKDGIKVYPKLSNSGGTGPYSGRLITHEEIQSPRFPYIKDTKSNFYSIDSVNNWNSSYFIPATGPTANPVEVIDSDYLRIKNNNVNWENFSGFDEAFAYIDVIKASKQGISSMSFNITGDLQNGDEIRIKNIDWNNPEEKSVMDNYTIRADDSIDASYNLGLAFSIQGTKKDIAKAISNSINYIYETLNDNEVFKSISKGSEVIVYTLTSSSSWNDIKYSLFSTSVVFPFSLPEGYPKATQQTYLPSPVNLSTTTNGWFVEYNFIGSNQSKESRIIVEKSVVLEFYDDEDPVYIKTNLGYTKPNIFGLNTDRPIRDSKNNIIDFNGIDDYYIIDIDPKQKISINSSNKVGLYKTSKNSNGYFTIFPIKDFDFDSNSTEYNKSADSDPLKLFYWYKNRFGYPAASPTFDYPNLTVGSTVIDRNIGTENVFVSNNSFQTLNGMINDYEDTNETVINEYDRLKENYISELALSSKVVPFINKWVYDNESKDVRENDYRLNTDQSFGYSNYSPSLDEFSRNFKFFTHEWYYLQKYPPYMSFKDKKNSFSYFEEDLNFPDLPKQSDANYDSYISGLTGGTGNLLSVVDDYFLSYFTREKIQDVNIPREFKYSIFGHGDDRKFSETLFRGGKVLIKDRSEYSSINYNTESLKYISNSKYNGYKFSAVLTYTDAGTKISVIKNDKWKSITCVIQANLNDITYNTYVQTLPDTSTINHKFIDRSHLYSITDVTKNLSNTDVQIGDVDITGTIESWDNNIGDNFFTVIGNGTNFISDMTLNEFGSYNDIRVGVNQPFQVEFKGISDVSGTTFRCRTIETNMPSGTNNTLNPGTGNSYNNLKFGTWGSYSGSWEDFDNSLRSNIRYLNGGFDSYNPLIESISFASIAKNINSGDPSIKYIEVTDEGSVNYNTFSIELGSPDTPMKSTYIKKINLIGKPKELLLASNELGFELAGMSRMNVNQITRHRGGYNPKWRDIFQFIENDDIINEGLEYNNIEICTNPELMKEGGLEFGTIRNLYYNKVNTENPNIILKSTSTDKKLSILPLIGEIAIDYKDYFVFRSSWDPFYYEKYNKALGGDPVIGTREPKEEKSFFGSKTISIPNQIILETFPNGSISKSKLGSLSQIRNVKPNIVENTIVKALKKQLEVKVYANLALENYLILDGFDREFNKYINPEFSFGDPIITDDVKMYIRQNIYERYTISKIIFWEKQWFKGDPYPKIEYNLTDEEKREKGYTVSKNFSVDLGNPDDLLFKLIYNIPKDKNFSIAFTVILDKK